MPKRLRLVLADDHKVLRSGLRMLLNAQPDMQVVGEAADGEAVIAVAREEKPDILLLDLSMPRVGGLEALRRLVAEQPWVRVLILTMYEEPEFVRAALAGGAAGYVVKQAEDSELIAAIRTVARGENYVYPTVAARTLVEPERPRPPAREGPGVLSQRETEVLQLVALGYSNQEIARRLVVSVKTVETYRARIGEKLDVRSRSEVVRYAMAHGLVQN